MSVIASRASWGPKYKDGFEVIGTSGWHEVYVHHSVTAVPGGAGASLEQERQHMRDLEGIGQREFGGGISYTVIVFPSGRAYQGHSLNTQGAHTYQRNNIARAICFVGNFENEQPTTAAMNTACDVLAEWRAAGLPDEVTGGHRDVFATACPGRNLYARLDEITADNGGAAPKEDDDMPLVNEVIQVYPVPGGKDTRKTITGQEALGRAVQAGWSAEAVGLRNEQKLVALTAAVSSIATNAGITPEKLIEDMRAAVREENEAHLYRVDAVIRESLGADNAEVADMLKRAIGQALLTAPNGGQ